MNASFMDFVLGSANEGISRKRVGNSRGPKQKKVRTKTIIVGTQGDSGLPLKGSSPLPCCPLPVVTSEGGPTVNKTEGVAATTAEVTTRGAFSDFVPTMVAEGWLEEP